jgi:DNA-directed RNA polymerase subunit A"
VTGVQTCALPILLDAAIRGDVDDLKGVTENVIVGQPIQLGTGDVTLVASKR